MSRLPLSIPHEVENRIFLVRGHRVMLDADLARMYGVETRELNQAVRRNLGRFPEDFMFRITSAEAESLKSQIVISKKGRGGRRYLPFAFTEQGVAMLSSVLKSRRAIMVNIAVMRAFVRIRHMLGLHRDVKRKLEELEHRVGAHDKQIREIFDALNRLIATPPPPSKKIGF